MEAAAGGAVSADEVAVAVDVVTDPEVVRTVADALAAGRRLHLRYWVPARDEATERVVRAEIDRSVRSDEDEWDLAEAPLEQPLVLDDGSGADADAEPGDELAAR